MGRTVVDLRLDGVTAGEGVRGTEAHRFRRSVCRPDVKRKDRWGRLTRIGSFLCRQPPHLRSSHDEGIVGARRASVTPYGWALRGVGCNDIFDRQQPLQWGDKNLSGPSVTQLFHLPKSNLHPSVGRVNKTKTEIVGIFTDVYRRLETFWYTGRTGGAPGERKLRGRSRFVLPPVPHGQIIRQYTTRS